MVTARQRGDIICAINILEAEPSQTKTKSLTIPLGEHDSQIESFSPATHRVSISISRNNDWIRILDVRDSRCLLYQSGGFAAHCFSPDGSLLAASLLDSVHVWKYNHGSYIPWRKLPSLDDSSSRPLLFSSTSSSILGHFADTYRLWRLDGPSAAPATCDRRLTFFSRSGTYVANAHRGSRTITITNLFPQISSQLIDAGMKVERLALTGNVLLTVGYKGATTCRLAEEGTVYGVSSKKRVDCGDNIWTELLHGYSTGGTKLFVGDKTEAVGYLQRKPFGSFSYDTRTGEVHKPSKGMLNPILRTSDSLQDDCMYDNPSGDS